MAGSRLEKIGTIYTRTAGLMQSGALKWEDRPLWYDIYEKFPPKDEPHFARPAPKIKIKQIFYTEDKIRATFHRNNKNVGSVNLLTGNKYKSLTQNFIETYKKLEAQYAGTGTPATEEQLYIEAIDMLKREKDLKRQNVFVEDEEPLSLSTAFKEAQKKNEEKTSINLKVSDIFKD